MNDPVAITIPCVPACGEMGRAVMSDSNIVQMIRMDLVLSSDDDVPKAVNRLLLHHDELTTQLAAANARADRAERRERELLEWVIIEREAAFAVMNDHWNHTAIQQSRAQGRYAVLDRVHGHLAATSTDEPRAGQPCSGPGMDGVDQCQSWSGVEPVCVTCGGPVTGAQNAIRRAEMSAGQPPQTERCEYTDRAWSDGAVFVCILRRDHPSSWNHQMKIVDQPAPPTARESGGG